MVSLISKYEYSKFLNIDSNLKFELTSLNFLKLITVHIMYTTQMLSMI